MKITLTESDEHFTDLESVSEQEIEFDAIAICCDWTEYASALEAAEAYGFKAPESEDERADKSEEQAVAFLRDETAILELESGRIVVLNY